MLNTLRARLTLWYLAVLALLLIGFSAGLFVLFRRSLYDHLDAGLSGTLDRISEAVKRKPPAQALDEIRVPSQSMLVLDASGRVLAQRSGQNAIAPRLPPQGIHPDQAARFYDLDESRPDAEDAMRGVVRSVGISLSATYTIAVTQSTEPLDDQLDVLLNALYVLVPFSLMVAGAGGWYLARRGLAPVAAMSQQAQRITAQNLLDQRLPVVNPRDEMGRMAGTFNELLVRLSQSFDQQRQFMADASHELRIPLSAIRTAAGVALSQEQRDESEYREALAIIEQQSRRLTRIVEDMFALARADAGNSRLQSSDFYLDELLTETAGAAAVVAMQKLVRIEVPAMPEAPFRGDEDLLRQMTWNLLDNAIKHTPQQGMLRLALELQVGEYRITVEDNGTGIAPAIQRLIFERFFRGDPARASVDDTGAGLGLPIARWIEESHGGRLELERSDISGSTFVITLPRRDLTSGEQPSGAGHAI